MKRFAIIALALAGCTSELPPTGQVVLFFDTDAPVPSAPGDVRPPDAPAALFDTLLVEVFEPGATEACDDCGRTFALDESILSSGSASIGIPIQPGSDGYRVRARLYTTLATVSGLLPDATATGPPQSVIDITVELPPVDDEGVVERLLFLPTDVVGLPQGSLDAPVSTSDTVGSSRIGSWPGAQRVDCAAPPGAGEVCVPGGAFWMGNAFARGPSARESNDRLRLVSVSPFYMDATEATVREVRDAGFALNISAWSGDLSGNALLDYCTYTTAPGPNDDKPAVCMTFVQGQAHCTGRGAELPTEAQFEYVASGLASNLFVWGNDYPGCDDAVINRAGVGLFGNLSNGCPIPVSPGGPDVVGTVVPRRDRIELPTGTIYDLVGNTAEWAADVWNRQDGPCWSMGGVFVDPRCETEDPAELSTAENVARGGAWIGGTATLIAAHRLPAGPNASAPNTGARCVRPATP
jgi:sulfatase modifying factor 1